MTTLRRVLRLAERLASQGQPHPSHALRVRFHLILMVPVGLLCLILGLLLLACEAGSTSIPLLVVGAWPFVAGIPLILSGKLHLALSFLLPVAVAVNLYALDVEHDPTTAIIGLLFILVLGAWTQSWRFVLFLVTLCVGSVLVWPLLPHLPATTVTGPDVTLYAALITMIGVTCALGSFSFDRVLGALDAGLADNAQLTAELSRANSDLERRVNERTQELQEVLHRQRKLTAELDELSQRDDLTGLYNRRRLMNTLTDPFMHDRTHSLVMVDIDHFKEINDSFGHAVGDQVLRKIAGTLSTLVREDDVLARIGGEEFALLLPDTTQDAAARLGERLRDAVAALPWGEELEPGYQVTISVGVAGSDQHPGVAGSQQWDQLLLHADKAMYVAKASGRNRAVAAVGAGIGRFDIRPRRASTG
ncbi:MAG: hypothetical protein CSA58_07765 [Micrococcales bacterium]|nr:MAG: hypothetical protein CSB46_07635 [Micrococcales bacterium]PIE26777.1 MAG: hypothetical protein CSA58_07765 [Micrococcales bacterium]